ncbi:hypothetical protein [Pelagibius marinus]|uniref:hypothetical protein n=1 Tax=Pelagibius marinus TaxID=2762760 RepID=UPI0018722FDD|nr:hypothetical protein [Pelagibius marinus]
MFNHPVSGGLRASILALGVAGALSGSLAGAAQAEEPGLVDQMASQLAARSDSFAATTAGLNVVPIKMAGSCPRAFMLQVNLGAQSPGTLSYQIETLDGRTSQVFKTRAGAREDGLFGARVEHMVALAKLEDGETDPSLVKFDNPTRPAAEAEAESEPGFFERLFGVEPAADPSKGLREQSFRVKIVAPNEIASTFDQVSVTCEDKVLRHTAAAESQRDGRDSSGRDRDRPGRDSSSGGSGSGSGGASGGGTDASGGTID